MLTTNNITINKVTNMDVMVKVINSFSKPYGNFSFNHKSGKLNFDGDKNLATHILQEVVSSFKK